MKTFGTIAGLLFVLFCVFDFPGQAQSTSTVVVSPSSTNYLNPDHVRQVTPDLYPPDVPTTNAPTTTAPSSAPIYAPGAAPKPPAVFVPPDPIPAHANWTWDIQDREFNHVVITKIEADRVSINCDTGPTKIDIAILPHDLQKMLNFDPILAAQAAATRRAESSGGQ